MSATLIEKRVDLDKFSIVKYQLMHYCFVNSFRINDTELNLLALMGEMGKIKLQDFGKLATERNFVGSIQAGLNALMKLERSDLFIKNGCSKKLVYLNPKLKIISEGNIVINLRLVRLEQTKNTGANLQSDSLKVEPAGAVR